MGELGLQDDSVTLMVSGGIGVVQFVAVLPVIIFIDRLGKRRIEEHSTFCCLTWSILAGRKPLLRCKSPRCRTYAARTDGDHRG